MEALMAGHIGEVVVDIRVKRRIFYRLLFRFARAANRLGIVRPETLGQLVAKYGLRVEVVSK